MPVQGTINQLRVLLLEYWHITLLQLLVVHIFTSACARAKRWNVLRPLSFYRLESLLRLFSIWEYHCFCSDQSFLGIPKQQSKQSQRPNQDALPLFFSTDNDKVPNNVICRN